MAGRVQKFANRTFFKTAKINLLRRLLEPYFSAIGLNWSDLPENDSEKRDDLFELFGLENHFPMELRNALHRIQRLSGQIGARILIEQAQLQQVDLQTNASSEGSVECLDTRSIALAAYLDHRSLFDRAADLSLLWTPSRMLERRAACMGIRSRHDDFLHMEDFRSAAQAFFLDKYRGNFCDVRWYPDNEWIGVIVSHGRHRKTANVEENGVEETLSYREISEDVIRYSEKTGRIKVAAESMTDAQMLVALFALHLLGKPDAFSGAAAKTLYTLQPIQSQGADFTFMTGWDDTVSSVSIVDVQADDGRVQAGGGRRMSPWNIKMGDDHNAVKRLGSTLGNSSLTGLSLKSVRLMFHIDCPGSRKVRVPVRMQPPDILSIHDQTFEDTIYDHLQQNGLLHDPSRSANPNTIH
ncbi:hypothetical protein ACOI1H_21300 [Loktanella sp. DJP18]|uniref:hypothetical protein n=1 Tax=Loktanella sp. DJP18 TaxID=3409788 RepID=UPI003BB72E25